MSGAARFRPATEEAPVRAATIIAALVAVWLASPVRAEPILVAPVEVTDRKAVFGRIETRDRVAARARIGGVLGALSVAEGDMVAAGDVIAVVADEKLAFRLEAVAARRASLRAQLANAEAELGRGEDLLARGVATAQRLDALRTQVDVLRREIEAIEAEARVIEQEAAEGAVAAPTAGRVLDVPVTPGAVILPGETVALIGSGGAFLRIAVPERHAGALVEGAVIEVELDGAPRAGRLARVYPLIENGRVIADVEMEGLSDRFVDARALVRLPVARRPAILLPAEALITRGGLDFVMLDAPGGPRLVAVAPGERRLRDGVETVEILTGHGAGDRVLADHE
jgi:RND family efflux transporter MFP subunit